MYITVELDDHALDVLYRAKVIQDKTDVELTTQNMQCLLEYKIEEIENYDL